MKIALFVFIIFCLLTEIVKALSPLGKWIIPIIICTVLYCVGWVVTVCLALIPFYCMVFSKFIKTILLQKRIVKLMDKYDDEDVVDGIISRKFWIGQTASQLFDSLGKPADCSEWQTGKDYGETWKYGQTGKNRYNLKISLHNGIVASWDQK